MNTELLDRSFGYNSPTVLQRSESTRLLHTLQHSKISFTNDSTIDKNKDEDADGLTKEKRPKAHPSGVNAITVDKFEGRYLLSAGADSSIAIWDLESTLATQNATYLPVASVSKTAKQHKLGITQLSFYPFDSLAFLSSSYDHTVRIYDSETLKASATFNLDSVVYAHALSPIASHLLVACATQHPAVRLVDLRSGATTHSLAGHNGAILSVAWSPTREHILASGSTDGTVRFWDVRRSVGDVGVLDMEDSIGIGVRNTLARNRGHGRAHAGPVNGMVWTENGQHLITAGHDQRVRVWDTDTAANTLVNFGPTIRNQHLAPLIPMLAPTKLVAPEKDVLFYPNEHGILMYEMYEGLLLKRLRLPDYHRNANAQPVRGQLNVRSRITSLAWRAHDIQFFSAHSDGTIASWAPRTPEDIALEEEEEEESRDVEADESRKRKREDLEDLFKGLTKRQITFGGS